ncbi:MAG TPA: hypothetical protein VGS11_02330 [Candidatus Bathyarchaeia archaeon]|nr:hypothetical protein [Candidatus Bathyarchaeia archaeon]
MRFDKHTLQTLEFALIVLGFLLFLVALLGGSGVTTCPVSGCVPGPYQWYAAVGFLAFVSGIALMILGIVLLILARDMKPEQETDVPPP